MPPFSRHSSLGPALAVVAIWSCSAPAVAAPQARPSDAGPTGAPFVAGEAIVAFDPGTSAGERGAARRAASVEFERTLVVPRSQLVAVDGGVRAAIQRLERQPGVAYAQPNYRYHALAAPTGWSTSVFNGGVEWGLSATATTGSRSAADSPNGDYGNAIDAEQWGESRLVRNAGANLTGERGCRMHFNARYALEEDFDFLEVGAVTPAGFASLAARGLTGSTGGAFYREEVSIAAHDGKPDVRPWFALLSDETVTRDGAYVDDLRLICRDDTYVDAVAPGSLYDRPDVGNYVRFNGTSMAAPHVAGVAALVRAAAPDATYADVVSAIKQGGQPLASLAGKTSTGCTVDAAGAIAVALGTRSGPCSTAASPPASSPPDDTFFDQLWGLEDAALPNPGVGALGAWATTKGAGQVIAIVDTGVDLAHPDLTGNLWTGPGGVQGFDAVDDDTDPDDYEFHGSHVAGTAAATAGNGRGIAGVAPEARIMPVRVLDGDGSGTTADIADGIVFAAANGADVVNLSLGGPAGADTAMSAAIATAAVADVVVVAAAGNDGVNNDVEPTTPCALPNPNIVCVAAVNEAGGVPSFSNFGATTVDVGAPGTNILSAKTDYGAPLLSDGFEPVTRPSTEPPGAPPIAPPLSPPLTPSPPPPPPPPPPATAPAKPDLSGSKSVIRVSKRGGFRYAFKATPRLTGRGLFRTRKKAVVARRAHLTVASKPFSVGSTGKVTLELQLSKKNLRILRRNRRLLLEVTVTVRNSAGLASTAAKRLTLRLPKR